MANVCKPTRRYSKSDYNDLAFDLELARTDPELMNFFKTNLKSRYGNAIAEAILKAIEKSPEEGGFSESWDYLPTSSTESVDTPINYNGAKSVTEEPDEIEGFYINSHNSTSRRDNMTRRFFEDVISKTVFDKSSGKYFVPSTGSVNEALYQYKKELLNRIWNFTGISHENEIDEDDFGIVISKTLAEYKQLEGIEGYDSVYDDYVILKRFDKLIRDFVPFVKMDAAFVGTDQHARNMYVYDPSGTYRQNWTDSEDASIEKAASPLVKLLAEYFTTATADGTPLGVSIGFMRYNAVMSTVFRWMQENRINSDVKKLREDIWKKGINADFGNIIDTYIRLANPSDNEKQILWGIKKYVFDKYSNIPSVIRNAFANQAFIQAKYSYIAYRQNFNANMGVEGQYLEDSFIDTRSRSLHRVIQSKVWLWKKHKTLFDDLCRTHGIQVVDNKNSSISIYFDNSWGAPFSITISPSAHDTDGNVAITVSDYKPERISDEKSRSLISDFLDRLIGDDYENILHSVRNLINVDINLLDTFFDPITIILAAVGDEENTIFNYDEDGLIRTYPFKSRFTAAVQYASIADGINELNVLRNGEGNNLPIYQMAPAIFDIFDTIDYLNDRNYGGIKLKSVIDSTIGNIKNSPELRNVLASNSFVKNGNLLKRIVARSDVKIGNVVKSSDKLNESEVAELSFIDFYQNLHSTSGDLAGCIVLQPITYSDKKTHFLPVLDVSNDFIGGKNVAELFKTITNPNSKVRQVAIKTVLDKIVELRTDKTKRQVYNQYLRFINAVNKSEDRNLLLNNVDYRDSEISFRSFDESKGFYAVAQILENINLISALQNKKPIDFIRTLFKDSNTALNEDFDFLRMKDGSLQANETLAFNIRTYNTRENLDNYIKEQKARLASDLSDCDVTLDLYTHPELKAYFDKFGTDLKSLWIDSYSGIMKNYRLIKEGNEIYPTLAQIQDGVIFNDPEITVELNPMIEGLFYANMLYGGQFNDILFGGTEGYSPKVLERITDFKTADLSTLSIITASRLSNEFKRTTFGGAVKRKYAQGLKFGVSKKANFAVVEDNEVGVSTLRGDTTNQVAQDGSGWVNGLMARMIQKSLVDSPVGDVRKTIAGWVDPRFGTQIHFKWAETTITMDLRQKSDGDGSAEVMYRKSMEAVDIHDKFANSDIDFTIYYNPDENGKQYKIDDEIVTTTKPIFRYDLDSGQYSKLVSISKNGDTLEVVWRNCDEHGKLTTGGEITSTQVDNLYDIDQALGGAFTYELDTDGNMQTSENVHDILYHIVCTNDMKEDFIGYIVNHSANKAGAINVNSYDSLNNDGSELRYHYISTEGFGVQMDADHDMNFADVTEMSQMVSLLAQGGNNIEIVNRVYTDIGRVAAKAMNDILAAIDTASIEDNNADKIYSIIGKALLDTFESSAKEELGLAQSFIRSAQNAILNETGLDNVILPYSSESIKGSFVAAVISLINKTGIKRKYAGFGGVQVPADRTMQHYDMLIGGNRIAFDYRGMRDYIRPTLEQSGITFEQAVNQQIINNSLNPFLEAINPKDIRFEDTIMYRPKGYFGEGTVLKIDTFAEFDFVRNLLGDKFEVYRWSIKPRELAQNDLRISTSAGTISEYDLDSVRASFYISELIAYKEGESDAWLDRYDRKIAVIKSAIEQSDLPNTVAIETLLEADVEFLKECKKLLITKTQNYMNDINNMVNSHNSGKIAVQMSQVNDDSSKTRYLDDNGRLTKITVDVDPNIQNITAQVVIGRRNFAKFGLRRGDKLYDIKRKGARFFYERLQQDRDKNLLDPEIPKSRYDGVLRMGNNDKIIVLVGDQDISLSEFGPNQEFRVSNNAVSYKGRVIFDNDKLNINVKDLLYLSYVSETGETIPAIWVPDWNTFDLIASSEAVKNYTYNYNLFNVVDLVRHTHPESFDKDGNAITPIPIGNDTYLMSDIENYANGEFDLKQVLLRDGILEKLNEEQDTLNNKALWRKATILYRNFMHQLQMIQTRIPSQAMQSTMNIEVVDFADIDTNYIWVNKKIFKLQGSDLDIDKAYCMAYDIDEAGNIYAMSDLIKFTETLQDGKGVIYKSKYDVDEVLLLETPNRKRIVTDPKEGVPVVDFTETFNKLRGRHVRRAVLLNELLKVVSQQEGNRVRIVVNGLDEDGQNLLNDLIKDANIHNRSKRSKSETEAALRNRVLASARQIMNMPASQLDAETPIDMGEPRDASKLASIGSKERFMTLDNFMSIFIMQKQYMSGKQVIAMTATGIKSYFIVTTYYNTLAKQLEGLLNDYAELLKNTGNGLVDPRDTPEALAIADNIVAILNEISFDGKFGQSSENPILRTFANVNFYNIKKAIASNRGLLSQIHFGKDYKEANYNTAFKNYAHNDSHILDLEAIVNHLDIMANGNTWVINNGNWEYFKVNAPDSLSALLSAATDNAKELILEKLNATVQFADLYTTLISQGVKFKDIAKILTNKAFGIVKRFATPNIFDVKTSFFNTAGSINFVLNEQSLSVLPKGMFEAFVTDIAPSVNKSYNGFLKQLLGKSGMIYERQIVDGVVREIDHKTIGDFIYNQLLGRLKLTDAQLKEQLTINDRILQTLMLNNELSASSLLERIVSSKNDSIKNALAQTVLDLFIAPESFYMVIEGEEIPISTISETVLLNTLRNAITSTKEIRSRVIGAEDQEELSQFDPTDVLLDAMEDPNFIENWLSADNNSWFEGTLTKANLIDIYRYVKKFFIPKNQLWNKLTIEEQNDARENLKVIRDEVLYAAQEMKMLGAEASINQGMKTRSYDEYHRIAALESFVNRAYINRGKGAIQEEFDFIKFQNDSEYRGRQIDNYDKVKAAVNILKAIQLTANFKEMYNYIGVARDIIERSAAIKLERRFAHDILRQFTKSDEKSGINWGATRQINQADFKTISRYVRDLIVLNYFAINGKNLEFTVPKGQWYYDPITGVGDNTTAILTRSLGNIHDIATFKHLMDHYIIPKLQSDPRFSTNRFIKNLSLDRGKDPKSGKPVILYKLQDNITDTKNQIAKDRYDGILEDFNKILYMPIDGTEDSQKYGIGNWTIGNLFFIYNLLVDKERISGNAITKLFSDLVSSNNRASLPYSYYKYLNDLDKGIINIYNSDGSINEDAFAYNIADLQYRLSDSRNANNYGVKETRILGKLKSVSIKPSADAMKGEDWDIETDSDKLSDYVFDMRFLTKIEVTPQVEHLGNFNSAEKLTANAESVFNAVTEQLAADYGKEIPIAIFGDNDIEKEFADLTEEQKASMKASEGFIMNGNIYINGKKANIEAPMHEMMHFVCALMKFSSDKNVRKQYYEILDAIGKWIDGNLDLKVNTKTGKRTILNESTIDGLIGNELKERLLGNTTSVYGNRHLSDIKEEVLVTIIGKIFKNRFEASWGTRRITPQFIQANVKQALSKVFHNDAINALNVEIGNVSLVDIMKNFASQLLSTDSMLLDMAINQNQELADLKDLLIKNGLIELSEECL